jgi:D-alanyl-D-alanine carboxypeptidase
LIIKRITGRSWRHEVTRRVITPLGLTRTYLPAPGHRSIAGVHAHGYGELDGETVDITRVDPSFAGAAGAAALVSTVRDLARFLDALFKGRAFRRRQTLKRMLDLAPAQAEGGLVGYGLGIERRALPGGVELIGHLGGAPGYRSYVGRVRPPGATIAFALNTQEDPTTLVLSVVQALAAQR